MHSLKLPNVKPRVQTFGLELPWPFDLDGHSVRPPKAKAKSKSIPFV